MIIKEKEYKLFIGTSRLASSYSRKINRKVLSGIEETFTYEEFIKTNSDVKLINSECELCKINFITSPYSINTDSKFSGSYCSKCRSIYFMKYDFSPEAIEKKKLRASRVKAALNNKTDDEWLDIVDKRKETSLEKYGVESPMQCKEVQDKAKATNLEKYGAENVFASVHGKNRIKETNLERYGAENVFASDHGKAKIKETFQDRYGVDNPFQSEEIKEKIKVSKLDTYGDANYTNREKAKETNLEKYGVSCHMNIPDNIEMNKEKRKESIDSRYGSYKELRELIREKNSWGEFRTDLSQWEKYKLECWTITNEFEISSLVNFDKRGLAGIPGAYQLDHKISMKYGFDNGISAKIIGNRNNLEMIPWEDNLSKSINNSITLEELYSSLEKD